MKPLEIVASVVFLAAVVLYALAAAAIMRTGHALNRFLYEDL